MRKVSLFIVFIAIIFQSCIKEKDTLAEMPRIEILSPLPCDTIYFGEAFHFTAKIIDNTGLGFISMDMHNNFGHHSHGNHATCSMDIAKQPVNPYINSWIFELPQTKKEYILDTVLLLDSFKNDTILYDFGDYHVHLYVTDNDGYQVFTSFDFKVLHR